MQAMRTLLVGFVGLLVIAAVVIAQAAPLTSPTLGAASITVDQQIHLGAASNVFKDGRLFLWDDWEQLNTALGREALSSITDGFGNAAFGAWSLASNTTGVNNTSTGIDALFYNTEGGGNTAVGRVALSANTTGNDNTAVGGAALNNNTTGSSNIALGSSAGYNLGYGVTTPLTSMSDNIFIGNEGQADEAHVIRIGSGQDTTFIAGIDDQTVTMSAYPVCVEPTGQLGRCPAPSSRRYKQDIQEMGPGSDRLLELRPVTFRFREKVAGGETALQFGLIAEEVAEVYPELVSFDEEGRPEAVKYRFLSSLLLNELQKQATEIQRMKARLECLETADPGYRQTGLRGPP